MKRIIIHWTAGTYQPNSTEFEHYHYLINRDGLVIKGKHSVQDNKNCTDGNYAAHTGGGNTGSIGVAVCCSVCSGDSDFSSSSGKSKASSGYSRTGFPSSS